MAKCSYYAKVTLSDKETHGRDWQQEGSADKVLVDAMKFISRKGGDDSIHERILNYLVEDFKAFDDLANKFFKLGKYKKIKE